MMLVVDANVLFAALIKNSTTVELLFEEYLTLYTPEFIMSEFSKYEDVLLSKTKRTKEQFIEIMHMLKEIITVVPKEEYSKFMNKAEKISPDTKDVAYIALALKLNCGIWSNDKKLKEQTEVNVHSTNEIMELI